MQPLAQLAAFRISLGLFVLYPLRRLLEPRLPLSTCHSSKTGKSHQHSAQTAGRPPGLQPTATACLYEVGDPLSSAACRPPSSPPQTAATSTRTTRSPSQSIPPGIPDSSARPPCSASRPQSASTHKAASTASGTGSQRRTPALDGAIATPAPPQSPSPA